MKKVYIAITIIFLPVILLLTTVEVVTFNTDYFLSKFEEYNISKVTRIKEENLKDITDKLLGYLKDDTNNLEIRSSIDGEKREVFNEKEKLHMIDVKNLFIKGKNIRNISIVLVAISLIILKNDRLSLSKTLMTSSIFSFLAIAVLSVMIYVDFDKYFTYFHEIFFTNDLWLLNPNTDVLIQMLPIEFFYSIATKISIIFIIELLIVFLIGIIIKRSYKLSTLGND